MIPLLLALQCLISNPHDGALRGFTWKPSGAHFVGAVPVLPGKFIGNRATITLYSEASHKRIGFCQLKSSGICPDSPECLSRPTFICSRSGKQLERLYGSLTLRVDFKGECTTYFLKRPSHRID